MADITTETKKLSRVERLQQELEQAQAVEAARQAKADQLAAEMKVRKIQRLVSRRDRLIEDSVRLDERLAALNTQIENHEAVLATVFEELEGLDYVETAGLTADDKTVEG